MRVKATISKGGLISCPDEFAPLIESARYIIMDMLHMAPRAVFRPRPVQLGRLSITFLAHGSIVVSGRVPEPVNIAKERYRLIHSYKRLKKRLPAMVAAEEADMEALRAYASAICLSEGLGGGDVVARALELALTAARSSLYPNGVDELLTPHCNVRLARHICRSHLPKLEDSCTLGSSWDSVANDIVHALALPARVLHGMLKDLVAAARLAAATRRLDCTELLIIPIEEGGNG